ncbi:MAG: helix-turn-helix transcriptional regulator [Bacteroidales bacterium]|jgi:transcriptional regulator with XRE-family HTH domain|nr:helix-turn-helix transcriptional regulator [Bacteroidales bacterium]
MKSNKTILLPRLNRIMEELGERIKLARLRRKLSLEQVSQRAGISRSTLWAIEKGSDSVAVGSYLQVLFVLGLENDFTLLAKDDELGRKLQDIGLVTNERAPKRNKEDNKDKT